jgi:oxygen-dependent protoporphyrinogen oxidase
MFQTLRGGLQAFAETVGQHLSGVRIITGVSVRSIEPLATGGYKLPLDNGEELIVQQAVVTAPAFAAADLVETISPEAAAILRGISYVSVATVAFGYPREAVQFRLGGTGFVVPSAEGLTLTACTYVSTKWPHASREDQVLFRSYLGHAGREVRGWSQDRLVETARRELSAILPLRAEPSVTRAYHWEDAMPQYKVGHLNQMAKLEQSLCNYPGLHVAGSAYRGLGLPDCIKQGKQAADNVLASL